MPVLLSRGGGVMGLCHDDDTLTQSLSYPGTRNIWSNGFRKELVAAVTGTTFLPEGSRRYCGFVVETIALPYETTAKRSSKPRDRGKAGLLLLCGGERLKCAAQWSQRPQHSQQSISSANHLSPRVWEFVGGSAAALLGPRRKP
eukprot:678882-Rhodomonas_salina.12